MSVKLSCLASIFLSGPVLASDHPENRLTDTQRAEGWRLLFDGETLQGWRGYHSPEPPPGWRVDQGTLHFDGGQGDLVTEQVFADFELALEWRIGEGGNSGIFYRAALGADAIYRSAPEMQVLDDQGHADGANPLTAAGSAYGLYPAPRDVVRPAGAWNAVRIRVQGNRVEHWLNGRKIVEYVIRSPEWRERVAQSKFADWPEYGQSVAGHIGLQDHGDPVWYRNIRVRVLD